MYPFARGSDFGRGEWVVVSVTIAGIVNTVQFSSEGQQLPRSGWYRLCTSGWLRTKECTRQAPTRGFVTQRSRYGMVPLRPATAVLCHRRHHAGLC